MAHRQTGSKPPFTREACPALQPRGFCYPWAVRTSMVFGPTFSPRRIATAQNDKSFLIRLWCPFWLPWFSLTCARGFDPEHDSFECLDSPVASRTRFDLYDQVQGEPTNTSVVFPTLTEPCVRKQNRPRCLVGGSRGRFLRPKEPAKKLFFGLPTKQSENTIPHLYQVCQEFSREFSLHAPLSARTSRHSAIKTY